jgi:hypothetical protein
MLLPIFQTAMKDLQLLQNKWTPILNGLLKNPSLQSNLLSNVSLINGTTTINHLLGQKLVGWRIVGINGAATIYDAQATNTMPALTLVLVSDAAVTVSLEVF